MELLRGKHILPRDAENFYEICESLGKFTGVICLMGKVDGHFLKADLLICDGDIIAASVDNLDKREITLKVNALVKIRDELVGSVGSLDIYEFDGDEMVKTIDNNRNALLDSPTPLNRLGFKITPMKKKSIKLGGVSKRGILGNISIPKVSVGTQKEVVEKKPNVKNIDLGVSKDIGNIMGGIGGSDDEIKRMRLREIKRKKYMEDSSIVKKITKLGSKKPDTSIKDGGKIKTTIDRLYELVKKYKKVRIDGKLERTLNVKKTQIEEWAMILEEHNLVELHYPAIGEPEIRISGGD